MSFGEAIAEGIEARSSRAFARSSGRGAGGGRPVIVKAISGIKRRSGAAALVRYVARLGNEQKDPIDGGAIRDPLVRVFDETGEEVPRRSVMQALDGWELLGDRANGIRGDPGRPRCVQVRHFVMSAPVVERRDRDALVQAVAATVQDTFGAEGHRCLWAMHEEHGRFPHVHVVVEAMNQVTGRRMRLDRQGELLDGLRAVLARQVAELGQERRDPSRRADREELIEQVRLLGAGERSAGETAEPSRPRRDPRPWLVPLSDAAPAWWKLHGAAALRRQGERLKRKRAAMEALRARRNRSGAGSEDRELRGRSVVDPPPSPAGAVASPRGGLAGLFDRMVGVRADASPSGAIRAEAATVLTDRLSELGVFRVGGRDLAGEAVRRFLALRAEAAGRRRGLAEWSLRKRPWIFAEVSQAWRRIEGDTVLREALAGLPDAATSMPASGSAGGGGREADSGASAAELLKWARLERERAILVRSLAGLAGAIERTRRDDNRALSEAAELRDRAYDFATAPREILFRALTPPRKPDEARPAGDAGVRAAPDAGRRAGRPQDPPPRRPGRARGRDDRER